MPSQVDQFVKDFEAAWNAGEQPSVAKFLNLVDEKERDELLARLLPIDIEKRIRAGDSLTATDYSSLGQVGLDQARAILDQLDECTDHAEMATVPPSDDEPLATSRPESDPPASKQIGSHKLLHQLGEGGMGTVWMAEQEKSVCRRVAKQPW